MSGACKYGDPLCPCQDGDMCHYEGSPARDGWPACEPWPPPVGYIKEETETV